MSYASFLKNVPEILSQPTGIAAIASLGIHGAIAFILPLMPVESSKTTKEATTQNKSSVGLSELSSNEQSRIPQKLPTTQPGIQSQLPPLPTQIAGLPSQQQLPPTITGAPTVLPPTPPTGSIGSLVPPTNSSALAPLERTSGFTPLPKGGNPVQSFRNGLKSDPSRYSTPMMSSRIPEFSSRRNRNYNSDLGNSRQQLPLSRLDTVASNPSTAPNNVNVPVYPPRLATGDMTTPPIGDTGNNYNSLNAVQPGNENRVDPNNYIAPVIPQATGNGKFDIATSGTPLPSYTPQPGGAIDNLNRPNGTPGASVTPSNSTTPGIGNNQNAQQNTNDANADAQRFLAFKNEYPQGQTRAPINLTMDKTKLDSNVKVSLIMDREGKIADFKLSGDAAKLPFPQQQAIRERLQQYFKENPTSTNGKGALFSFLISPGQVNSTQSNSTASGALLNNQTSGQSAQAPNSNNIIDRLSGTQSNGNQPLKAPEVSNPVVNSPINNTNRTTNSTPAPVLPPALPGALKPVGTLPQQQTIVPSLPLQKPISSSTDLPQTLRNVQVAPQVERSKPVSQPQTTTTASQPPRNSLVAKLRNTQSTESDSQVSLVEKLRQVKQQREKANQENTNP